MKRPTRTPNRIAKGSTKSETARPNAEHKVAMVEKTPRKISDPFALFTEWSGDADEKAFAEL